MKQHPDVPSEVREQFDILTASTIDVLPADEFVRKLQESLRDSRPLRIKYGADPSAPDIHLGHSVPIRKLKQFQDLGHQVVFLIGDYTGRIGDPSGKNTARPRLSKEEVNTNAKTYLDQIFKILDRDKTEVVYNSTWLETMDVSATIELMSKYTVSQMLEREDFHARFNSEVPIYIHEFIYPLLQGYDSIAIRADVEIGGTDQKFNLLVGRELQRIAGQAPQCIMTVPLLVGTDGANKMSKSLGNYIGISEPPRDMFGKAMSVPDDLMEDYFELVVGMPRSEIDKIMGQLRAGKVHPRLVKEQLARTIVSLYHGGEAADAEAAEFRARFTLREFPDDTAERVKLSAGTTLLATLQSIGAAKSAREAQRLLEQKAVHVFEDPAPHALTEAAAGLVPLGRSTLPAGTYKMKVGKTRFVLLEIR